MSKTVLILNNKVESCLTCRLNFYNPDYGIECSATRKYLGHDAGELKIGEIDKDCPLKELPEKKAIGATQIVYEAQQQDINVTRYAGYCSGWNDCLEEITA